MIPYCRSSSPDKTTLHSYLKKIDDTGILTNNGPLSKELEQRIELFSGRNCVSVSSGTIGLYISLVSVNNIIRNEEVIIPSYNFAAGMQAINLAGMKPVFVDIENDYRISLNHLRKLLKAHKKCRFVMAVNYYGWAGNPSEIETLVRDIEKEDSRKIYLIFDSAHAFGASYENRPIGSFGDFEVFSFSATKVIGGSEGGAVTCSSKSLLKQLKIAKNYGTSNYEVICPGINGKLSEPNAAYILSRMDFMDTIITNRNRLAQAYMNKLKAIRNITPPTPGKNWQPVFKDIVVQIPFSTENAREKLRAKLNNDGIDTRVYFWPPLRSSSLYGGSDAILPCTERVSNRVLALPFYDTINESEIDWVSDRLKHHLNHLCSELTTLDKS